MKFATNIIHLWLNVILNQSIRFIIYKIYFFVCNITTAQHYSPPYCKRPTTTTYATKSNTAAWQKSNSGRHKVKPCRNGGDDFDGDSHYAFPDHGLDHNGPLPEKVKAQVPAGGGPDDAHRNSRGHRSQVHARELPVEKHHVAFQ